jgi:hypothetical protein
MMPTDRIAASRWTLEKRESLRESRTDRSSTTREERGIAFLDRPYPRVHDMKIGGKNE